MRQCARWTNEEDIILERMTVKGASIKETAAVLNRTPTAIGFRRLTIGVGSPHRKTWTKEEEEYLVGMFEDGGLTIGEASKDLGRSRRSGNSKIY